MSSTGAIVLGTGQGTHICLGLGCGWFLEKSYGHHLGDVVLTGG